MVNKVNQSRKRAGLGELLFRAARLYNERAVARVRAHGAERMRTAHTLLFPHLAPEGVRLSTLATRLGISKPAVGKLVGELEAMGVLRVRPDPRDGRAKLVRVTALGRRAFVHGLGVLGEIEAELAARLGDAELKRLREALARVVDVLEA